MNVLPALLPQAETGAAPVEELHRVYLEYLPPVWILGLVVLPAVLTLAFLAYRKPKRDRLQRRILAGLRILVLAAAILFALGPFLRETRQRSEPAPLALLLDDSASIQHRDTLEAGVRDRLEAQGLARDPQPRRLDLLQALLASSWRTTLEDRYRLRAYRFAERLAPTAEDGSGLQANGAATALGDSLLALVQENRGRRLPDVILASDGRSNRGVPPEEAATRLAAEGVRVHVIALGDPRPAPDLALERVHSPDLVLAGDEALFLLRLRASGRDLPARATVQLLDEAGRLLDEAEVETTGAPGAQVALSARMEAAGERRLVAAVDPLPGETSRENNRLDLSLEVKEVKIRVLYVEGYPRWEYRYLKNRLTRAPDTGGDVETRCWLADASRDFEQETTPGLTPLRRIPQSVEELLRDYDVVILGDVDPADMDPDPFAGPRFVEAVADFVRRGGGLLVLAGPRHSPGALVGTALEPMLPVLLGREPPADGRPFHAVPSDPGAPDPVTLLAPDPRESQRLWQSAETLWWYHPVERLRPGAQAWLIHPANANAHGPHVVAAGGYVPDGWVGWIGTDETWRWRFPGGERYVERFWRSVLRNLAAARLRGDEGRARLDVDRTRVELGEGITVEARLRDEAYQPLVLEDGVDVFVEGRESPVHLAPVPRLPGTYRGLVRPSRTGPHLLLLTKDGDRDGDVLASARFSAVLPSKERRLTSQDTAALEALAGRTGGILVPIERADELLERLDGRERLFRTLASRDLPLDGSTLLAIFLVLACAEWLLRKHVNLS